MSLSAGNFNRLLTEQIPSLRRYARGLIHHPEKADDLVQDCLERALSRRQLWDSNRPLRPWLFTILHNLYANAARHFHNTPEIVSIDPLHETAATDSFSEVALQELNTALHRLSEQHREILLLVGLEQMSYQETAEILNLPPGTVMSRLARARKHLRELMQDPTLPNLRRVK